eukprot:118147-Amphidinium_carterae.1
MCNLVSKAKLSHKGCAHHAARRSFHLASDAAGLRPVVKPLQCKAELRNHCVYASFLCYPLSSRQH